jgi:hypothetical protein
MLYGCCAQGAMAFGLKLVILPNSAGHLKPRRKGDMIALAQTRRIKARSDKNTFENKGLHL